MLVTKSKDFVQYIISVIIQKYFGSLHSVLILYNSSNAGQLETRYMDGVTEGIRQLVLQNKILVLWINAASLNDDEFQKILLKDAEIGSQGYISVLSNTSKFIDTKFISTQLSILRQRDKIFLLLSASEQPKSILANENLHLYPRHLLIVPKNESALSLWTQKYTGRRNNKEPILLNTLLSTSMSWHFANVFPDKLKNLQGRHVKVASTSYLPYMEAYLVENGKGHVRSLNSNTNDVFYGGTEACLIMEFCRLRNCTLKVEAHGPDRWGGIYDNGSSDGMFGSTYTRRTEIAIGCMYNWFNNIFDVSRCIAKSAVTLLVPAPLPLRQFQAVEMPFSRAVWMLIIVSVIISSIMYHLLEKNTINSEHDRAPKRNSILVASLRITAIFFQQSYISNKIEKRATRICIGCLLVATLILENSYIGRLKSLLTVPQYVKPINTVSKFVESNLKWGAPVDTWVYAIVESQIPYEQNLVKRFERKSYSELRNLSFSKAYGLGIERLNSGLYSFGSYITPDALRDLIVLKDNLYYDYSRMISIRGWPLMGSLNEFILQTLEHGLWNAWEKECVRKYLNPKAEHMLVSLGVNRLNKQLPTILNLSHVSGIFLILIFGYILGFLSFLCELVATHASKNSKATFRKKLIINTIPAIYK